MLEHELERLGRIVAADQGVRVTVRGDVAYATAGHINVPCIDTFDFLGADAERMLHGLLDHECGHARDTDFSLLEQAESPALRTLHNAIEDGYVESRQGARYVGVAQNLAAKNRWAWTRAKATMTFGQDAWADFCFAVALVVRKHGGVTLDEIQHTMPGAHAMLLRVAPMLEEVERIAAKPRATAECLALARRIAAVFERPPESKPAPKPESKPAPKSAADEGGEDPTEAGEGGPGSPEEGSDGSEGTAAAPEAGDDAAGATEPPGKAPPGMLIDLPRWTPPSAALTPEEQIAREIKKSWKDAPTAPYQVFSHEFDREVDLTAPSRLVDDLQPRVDAAADALAQAFDVGLRAKRARRPVPNSDEGMVDLPMLVQYAAGAASPEQIFCDLVAEDDRAVAVSILIDCSGSMAGTKAATAQVAALAMHRALAGMQIKHEITGFTSAEHHAHPWNPSAHASALAEALREAEARGADLRHLARNENTKKLITPVYGVFKAWDSEECGGLSWIQGIAENLDGEAVLWQARRLAQRPEPRRVMFVLSDGMPAGTRDNAQGARYLSECVQRVVDAGIEIYGVGILSDAVSRFYPKWWRCNSIDHLAETALGALVEVLVEGRHEVACVRL